MHAAIKIYAVLVVGAMLGLLATWGTVARDTLGGAVSDGPWRTNLDVGSPEAGPYLRAWVALHGLLALNRQEAVYYTATMDGDGNPLTGNCIFELAARDPPARWWSITVYGPDDYLIANPAGRYSVLMNSVARRSDGSFTIALSPNTQPGNWIPVGLGTFRISLRLYSPDKSVTVDPGHVALPTIRRGRCR